VDGERSSLKTTHPMLSDPAVRQALGLLVDRGSIHEQIYGRGGQATANYLNAPSRYSSKNVKWEFNVDKANQILDAAGWKRGADGIRAKDGKRLKFLYSTSTNAPRQKTQAIVKQAAAKAGIEIEIKSVVASVFFGSDPANPDNYPHFYSDLQMYNTSTGVDPLWGMRVFISTEVATKENKWSGRNVTRWRNEEYDRLWKGAETEMDAVKRAAMFIRMNDMVVQNGVVIPVNWRNGVAAASSRLRGMDLTGWDSNMWRLPYWHKA
jgi:peptide/nickel transport system substrate-binding protein